MNIFVLDKDPAKAARMICDAHVVKMCLETAQILSAAMLRRGMDLKDGMPKPQNINHPVIVATDEPSALNWVLCYYLWLLIEYATRFEKPHKYSSLHCVYTYNLVSDVVPDCSALHRCCGDLDVGGLDIVESYRRYYVEVKKPALVAKGKWRFKNSEDWT